MNPFSASISALGAFSTQVGVSANNLTNLNTNDYQAKRVVMTSSQAGVSAAVTTDLTPGPQLPDGRTGSNVNLAGEMVNLMTSQRYYQANARAIQIADDTLGSVIDILE